MYFIKGLVVVCLAVPGIAWAGNIGYAAGGVFGTAYNRNSGQLTSCSYGNNHLSTSGGCGYQANGVINQNSTTGQAWNGTPNFFSGYANSNVDVNGGLHAIAHAELSNAPVDVNCVQFQCNASGSATALAQLNDVFTFSGPSSVAGMLVTFNFQVDGTFATQGLHESAASAKFAVGAYEVGGSLVVPNNVLAAGTTNFQTSGFLDANGQVALYAQLTAFANVDCQTIGPAGGVHLCSPGATSDFSNTAKLTSILLQDGQGNVLSGYGVSSANGGDYGAALAASGAPEPAAWTLGAAGLAMLFVVRRRG